MNLILLFPEDFTAPNQVRLTDYRADHIREVHRAGVGKTLKVGRVNGGIGDGVVTAVGEKAVELEVRIPDAVPDTPAVSLILALPRPQTLKKVLETVGAFGVRRLRLVNTDRVQKSFFGSKLLKDGTWMKHLRLGMEQGGRTRLPQMSVEPSLKAFFEKAEENYAEAVKVIAHPGLAGSLWNTPLAGGWNGEIVAAVGPEGGWLDHEVEAFRASGFLPVRLGTTIHRVENAVTALLAQIELLKLKAE